jgi:hypothetical protein
MGKPVAKLENASVAALLARLGTYSRGKACPFVNTLADRDLGMLEALAARGCQRSYGRWSD